MTISYKLKNKHSYYWNKTQDLVSFKAWNQYHNKIGSLYSFYKTLLIEIRKAFLE